MALPKLGLCFCIFLFISPLQAKWDDLVVKWDRTRGAARTEGTAFFSLPTTASKAKSAGWIQADSDSKYWDVWCKGNDPRLCILTDQQGNFAGLEVGLPSEDFTRAYDLTLHPIYVNVTRFNTPISKTRFFLVPQDVLKSGGRADMNEGLGSGLWLQEGDKITEVPITESEIKAKTKYVEQNCVPAMGKHFYYNLLPTISCDEFEPYFLLTNVKTGELHGVGFQGFGKPSISNVTWFENIPSAAIKPTTPTAPDCLVDLSENEGVVSLHIYFIPNPWDITCTV